MRHILNPGDDTRWCPECGAEMGRARFGRNSQLWVRRCSAAPVCWTTTFTADVPDDVQPLGPRPPRPQIVGADLVPEIPTRGRFNRFDRATVAADLRRQILDARQRQVGSE
jgi:hypothetical protein